MSTVITLDRNRDYGTVHGEETKGAFFSQDGFHFDNEGNLLEHLMDAGAKERLARRIATDNAKKAAEAAYKKAMAEADMAEPEAPAPAPVVTGRIAALDDEPPAAEDKPEFDFRGWYLGTTKIQWFEVQKALKEHKSFVAGTKDNAAEFLSTDLQLPLESFRA